MGPSRLTFDSNPNHPIKSMKSIVIPALFALVSMAVSPASEIGKPAPVFTAKTIQGETVRLADFQGKVVVLEWANFECPFVKKHYASGNLPKLQETYTGKGVVWLTVNSSAVGKQGYLEPAGMVERAAKEGNKASHFLADADGVVGKAYGAKVTPHLFIIGKDGRLLYDGAIDSKATTEAADIGTAEKWFADALDAVLADKPVARPKNPPYGCGVKY